MSLANQNMAHVILGKDFITPENIMGADKNIVYTDEQLSQFVDTVPSRELLGWCRDNNYMLVAGPNHPMSLLEVRALRKDYFYSEEGDWCAEQKFAEIDKAETRWIMLRKEPVPGSILKNWSEQQALLSEAEVTPNPAEVVWCLATYKAVRGIYLLPNVYVRTSSCTNHPHFHVIVGNFDARDLLIDFTWDDNRFSDVWLASARKLT